jgi:small subunit ribosomal protein S21
VQLLSLRFFASKLYLPLLASDLLIYEDDGMTQVIVGDHEGIESALRRFKRQVVKAGIFLDMKKHRYFETTTEKRKRKAVEKRRQQKRIYRK